jgi:hypothetical protein
MRWTLRRFISEKSDTPQAFSRKEGFSLRLFLYHRNDGHQRNNAFSIKALAISEIRRKWSLAP